MHDEIYTDWLTATRVAKELGIGIARVQSWVEREDDPFPARLLDGNSKQWRVNRHDMNEWIYRNSKEVWWT